MSSAIPQRGSVVRYAYLWAREAERSQSEGRKDRPTLVLAVSVLEGNGTTRVFAVAITHTPPKSNTDAIAIPNAVKRALRLDDVPAWIVTTEVNAFVWPGPDVRPIPGRPPGTLIYGRIPDDLLERVVRSFLENRRKKRTTLVTRTR